MTTIHALRRVRRRQRGASLAIVLILLLVMTLLGVYVLRGTLVEERMSAGTVDRSVAFQAAESALREAEAAIAAAHQVGNPIGFDCDAGATVCPTIPANAYAATGACVAGAQDCWIDASNDARSNVDLALGVPQYYIEFMGQRLSTDELGQGDSANNNQYGGGGGVPMASFYRVTARSNNPGTAGADSRAVVVLQSTVVAQ